MKEVKQIIRDEMLEDIFEQGDMINATFASVEKQIKQAIDSMDLSAVKQVIMTGCGDSYYAGEVAKAAFYHYADLPAREVEAFEFVNYETPFVRQGTLMIAVSISGQVGTTLSTLEIAKEKGLLTFGINATPGSKMYQIADCVVDIGVRVREPGPVPQTYHYLGNMVALFITAMQIGLKRGSIDQAKYDVLKNQLLYNLSVMRENANELKEAIFALAGENLDRSYTFVGGGTNQFTAAFAVAKLHEAACMGGMYQETEEWAHIQHFGTNSKVLTFVLAPLGAGYARAKQIASSVKKLGGVCAVVTDKKNTDTFDSDYVLKIDMSDNEVFSVMSTKLPLELFAYSVSEHLDIRPFDYDNAARKQVCEENIYADGQSAEEILRQKG